MSGKKNVESPVQHRAHVQHILSKGNFNLQTDRDEIRKARLYDDSHLNQMSLDSSEIDTLIMLLAAWKEAIEDNQ